MRQSERYHQGGQNIVYRLHKSLYSLKQLAKQWNKKLYSVFNTLGFKYVQSDNFIYIYSKIDIKIIVLVFIDNITLVLKYNFAMASIDYDLQ